MKISYSRVRQWRNCPQSHYFRYIEGIEKAAPELPLIRGSLLHKMLETHLKGDDYHKVLDQVKATYDNLFEEEKATYGDLVGELDRIMKGYIKFYANDGLTYEHVEMPFDIQLFTPDELSIINADNVIFTGVIDGIAKDKFGIRTIIEHKSKSTIPADGSQSTDMQAVLYTKALEQLNLEPVQSVTWDYLLTKAPTKPKLLKSGKLSERADIFCDYDTYMEAIIENNLNPDDYKDILNTVSSRVFFKRTVLPLSNRSVVESTWKDFRESAIQIIVLGEKCKIKNTGQNCKMCSYKAICEAEINGNDADFIRESQFQKIKNRC